MAHLGSLTSQKYSYDGASCLFPISTAAMQSKRVRDKAIRSYAWLAALPPSAACAAARRAIGTR